MKITKKIKALLFALPFIMFTACSQDTVDEVPVDNSDEMSVSLRMSVPAWTDVSTRAGVSTSDIGISAGSMQLLCFDNHGFYLGMGTQVTVTPSDDFNGNLKAKVPSNTSRIHFIANANLSDNGEWIGMYENTLITKLTASEGGKMVYWGYVKKSSSTEMKTFLESGNNTVYMLRNEAKVTVVSNDATISAVTMTVCNDVNKGTLAPFNQKDLTNPFGYDSDGADATYIPSDAAIRTLPTSVGSDTEQFIFESKNTQAEPVRVILKVTYKNNAVRYHKIQLIDSKYQFYTIRRNHKYEINIKSLDPEVGYTTFTQAYNGNPSNNSLVNVDDIIPTITDYGNHTLSITDANGKETNTSVIYNTPGMKTIYFTYSGDNSMTAADFSASWLENNVSPTNNLTLTYSNGKGSISFPITSVSSELQYGKLTLLDTKNGLRRNVKVYAVSPFEFNASLFKGKPSSGTTTESTYVLKSTTGIKYTTKGTKTISFTYSGDNSMTASNFTVSVTGLEYGYNSDISNLTIKSYSNGKGTFSFDLGYVTTAASMNVHWRFTLTDTKHNTKVEILVCGNSASEHTHTETEVTSDGSGSSSTSDDGTYTLSFTIPDNYPEDLMPVTVRFTTNDFNPTDPTLDVVVDDTEELTGKDWDFWYEYKATTYGTHNLTLTPSRTSSTGNELWLKADNFNAQQITFSY